MRTPILEPLAVLLLLVLPLALPAQAQDAEDPGPFPVGIAAFSFTEPGSGDLITATLYYPAESAGTNATPDAASGPYPLVGFLHGWLGTPSAYDDLSTHIASWGFFVASIGTETDFFATMQAEANDTGSLLRQMEIEGDDAGSRYFGMISDDPWSAVGHSMGGGACFYLLGEEPRVEVLVPMEPYRGTFLGGFDGALGLVAGFEGRLLTVTGEVDTTAPPTTMGLQNHLEAVLSERRVYWEIEGAGHGGPTDFPGNGDPLSGAEQQRMHRKLVAGFLRAELLGDEDVYVEILGAQGQDEPLQDLRTVALAPVHWSAVDADDDTLVRSGVAGRPGDAAFVVASAGSASIPTAFGLLGLDLTPGLAVTLLTTTLGAEGSDEVGTPIDPALSGLTLYSQALVFDGTPGTLTRTASILLP